MTTINEGSVATLWNLASFFPAPPDREISRDNFVDELERLVAGGHRVIVVEGDPEVGKTVVLAQYCRRHPLRAFPVFVTPTDALSRETSIIRVEIANQIEWLLSGVELHDSETAEDPGFLRMKLFHLGRRAKRDQTTFVFVIDGINDEALLDAIIEMLAVGKEVFTFILAGAAATPKRLERFAPVSLRVTGWVLPESADFLTGVVHDEQDRHDLHRLCDGIPGRLASARRLVLSGVAPQELLSQPHIRAPQLFEREWERAEWTPALTQVLSVIAFDTRARSLADLSQIVRAEHDHLRSTIEACSFVTVTSGGVVSFISDSFRNFAATKLSSQKTAAINSVIEYLSGRPDDDAKLRDLPQALESVGRYEELLAYLNADRLSTFLRHSSALTPVRKYAERAHETAYRVGGPIDLMLTAAQRASLTAINNAGASVAEVAALVALGHYERALELAYACELREDRLQLLAVIGKAKVAAALPIDEELLTSISSLAGELDASELGPRLIDIAADLLTVQPDIAMKLLETAYADRKSAGALDWAVAAVSLSALQDSPTGLSEVPEILGQIKDPEARRLATEGRLTFGRVSAESVLTEVEAITDARDRIALLRSWAQAKRGSEGVVPIISRALDLIGETNEYVATARDLRELATPLQYLTDGKPARELVARIDSLSKDLSVLGSSTEFVRLSLLLAVAGSNYDEADAHRRVLEAYYHIASCEDPHVRAEGLAWLLKTIPQVDNSGLLTRKERLVEVATQELMEHVDLLLQRSAEHDFIMAPILKPLAKTRLSLAAEIARRLNTEPRRDAAALAIVRSAMDRAVGDIQIPEVCEVIKTIVAPGYRDTAIIEAFERLTRDAEPQRVAPLDQLWLLIDLVSSVGSAGIRARAFALAANLLHRAGDASRANGLIEKAVAAWRLIDGTAQVDVGFELVERLHEVNPGRAVELLEEVQLAREQVGHAAAPAFTAITALLRVAIRALGGMLLGRNETPEETDSVLARINQVNDTQERIRLFSALVLEFVAARRTDEAREIYRLHLRPTLDSVRATDTEAMVHARISAAAAVHATRPELLDDFLESVSARYRDQALYRVARFIMTELDPDEPLDLDLDDFESTPDQLIGALKIAEKIQSDSTAFQVIVHVAAAAARKNRYPANVRSDIAARIEAVARKKFPTPRYIQHDGYLILSLAQVLRLRGTSRDNWNNLRNRAADIDNVADRAFVFAGLAQAIPARESELRDELVADALRSIGELPSAYERIDHLLWMAGEVRRSLPQTAKKCLADAMNCCQTHGDARETVHAQRRVVDLAYRIDPDFANTLAKVIDNDPARKPNVAPAMRRLENLQIKQQLVSPSDLDVLVKERRPAAIAEAAWSAIGSLHAKRGAGMKFDDARPLLNAAGKDSIRRTSAIFAFVVESSVAKYGKTTRAREELRPFFDSMLKAADFVSTIFGIRAARTASSEQAPSATTMIDSGERTRAFEVIENWVRALTADKICICDPYFAVADLDVIHLLSKAHPKARFQVVTSKKHHLNEQGGAASEDDYKLRWADISDLPLPAIEVVSASVESSGDSPEHDRWLLCGDGGLKLGGSLNGLGRAKSMELRILSAAEADALGRRFDELFNRKKRLHNGSRVTYASLEV